MSTVTETLKSPKKLHCAWTGGVGAGGRPPLKSVTFLSEESKAGGGRNRGDRAYTNERALGRTRTSPRCRRTPAVPVPPTAEPNGKESSLHTCWRACGSSPVRCEGGSTCELLGTRQALAGNSFTQRSHARARLSSDRGAGKAAGLAV